MANAGAELVNQISMLVNRQVKAQTQTARIVTISSLDGPVLNDMGLSLPPDTFYISKSIDISSLKIGDRLLLVETKNDMPVVTDLLRTFDDQSDSFDVDGNLGVKGEIMAQDTIHAENGIRIKTFTEKNPPISGDPSDDDFIDPPVGTLALVLNPPALWVRTGVGNWEKVNG